MSTAHMIILLIVVLVIFGPKRIPEISEALGKSMRYFKRGLHDIQDELETPPTEVKKEVPPSAPATWSEGNVVKHPPIPEEKNPDEEKKIG
jgi:sec-independent protein translocase protein TatA